MGLNISPSIWQSYISAILDCLQSKKFCKAIMDHYFGGGMGQRKFYLFLVAVGTWSMRLSLNSVPLSDRMYLGHMCTGKYSLINMATIVSVDLSGIGNASGHQMIYLISQSSVADIV